MILFLLFFTKSSFSQYRKYEETRVLPLEPDKSITEKMVIEGKPVLIEKKEVIVQNDPAAIVEKKYYILRNEPVIEEDKGFIKNTVDFLGNTLAFPFEFVGGAVKTVF